MPPPLTQIIRCMKSDFATDYARAKYCEGIARANGEDSAAYAEAAAHFKKLADQQEREDKELYRNG